MKLYLLSRTDLVDYDQFDSSVVAALTEEDARMTHPESTGDVPRSFTICKIAFPRCWVDDPEDISVQLIGTALKGTKPGTICASFNAS